MSSVIKDWAAVLPFRYQGGLLVATRGHDGNAASAKPITRCIRYHLMHAADEREVDMDNAFMARKFTIEQLKGYLNTWDSYTLHFITHLMHACEIMGYEHPDIEIQEMFLNAYFRMVHKLHLNPETRAQLADRLTTDRIAKYGAANAPSV